MTVEMLVVVVVLLIVKYTLEFADRTRPRRRRRALKRAIAARSGPALVIDFAGADTPPAGRSDELDAFARRHGRDTPAAFWRAQYHDVAAAARDGRDWEALIDERIAGLNDLRDRWRDLAAGDE